jgi:ubiquinone/menaquinone biosynthesis C-methylase UbiE
MAFFQMYISLRADHVTAVDISHDMLSQARTTLQKIVG